jgi:hypothetical protein
MKIEGWQDRLPPVLGAMYRPHPLDKLDRDIISNLGVTNKRSLVDPDPVA